MVRVHPDECTGCGACIAICPVEAISMEDGKAVIYQELCTECGACITECPVEAIKEE